MFKIRGILWAKTWNIRLDVLRKGQKKRLKGKLSVLKPKIIGT